MYVMCNVLGSKNNHNTLRSIQKEMIHKNAIFRFLAHLWENFLFNSLFTLLFTLFSISKNKMKWSTPHIQKKIFFSTPSRKPLVYFSIHVKKFFITYWNFDMKSWFQSYFFHSWKNPQKSTFFSSKSSVENG